MGYNGPAPGIHIVKGFPVLTALAHGRLRKTALASLPQPGDPYPSDATLIACKPSRIEPIRPDLWSIDIPYIAKPVPPPPAEPPPSLQLIDCWGNVTDLNPPTAYEMGRTTQHRYELPPAGSWLPWVAGVVVMAVAIYRGLGL